MGEAEEVGVVDGGDGGRFNVADGDEGMGMLGCGFGAF